MDRPAIKSQEKNEKLFSCSWKVVIFKIWHAK